MIQACNPPDTYWALAAPFKPFGKRFVFDQHDLCPEVYVSRFPNGSRVAHRALMLLERATYALADHVVATNESYRETAIGRGHVPAASVTVVRTGPNPDRLRKGSPVASWRHGRRYLCAYLGVMGPQDGVDLALRAAAAIVRSGRDDVHFVLMGSGDSYDELVVLADQLGITEHVTFTGRIPDETVFEVLSTADVGLSPDPLNPLNDVSTMNKTMEYMAFELPVVAFDLKETRVSAGPAAVYAPPNDTDAFARAIEELLDDPATAGRDGAAGTGASRTGARVAPSGAALSARIRVALLKRGPAPLEHVGIVCRPHPGLRRDHHSDLLRPEPVEKRLQFART